MNKTVHRLAFADGLRGLAALWVVLFHLSEGKHVEALKGVLPRPLSFMLFDAGHLGVAIFFVLSGFVMTVTVQAVSVNFEYASKFILRRLVRLIPPYYASIFMCVILNYIKEGVNGESVGHWTIPDLLVHMFFLQGVLAVPHINIVYWTLCIEVQFYIVFIILFLFADYFQHRHQWARMRSIVIVSMCGVATLWPLGIFSTSVWTGGFLKLWYSFLVGVLVSWGGTGRQRVFGLSVCYCLALGIAGILTASDFTIITAISGLLLSIALRLNAMQSWLSWKGIQLLGLTSYSMYLLHNPITGLTYRVIGHWFSSPLVAELIGVIACIGACTAFSWIAFQVIERPSIAWSKAGFFQHTSMARRSQCS